MRVIRANKIFFIILGQGSQDPCPPPFSGDFSERLKMNIA